MDPSSSKTPGNASGINLPTPATPPTDDTSTTQPATPPLSGDNDSIEKEWVNKVKAIVKKTHGDPYRQSQDLTLLRANYMKQRYNKIIKVDT